MLKQTGRKKKTHRRKKRKRKGKEGGSRSNCLAALQPCTGKPHPGNYNFASIQSVCEDNIRETEQFVDLQILDPDSTDFLEKLVDLLPCIQMGTLMVIFLLQIQHPRI